ncbi:hypothetical protein V6N11_053894 [Hibiscus sabdariffa]|uniref:Uncharacterized protein n=1 Tax=Hibiscus sabdariffa TaxID=183260 RepID=A0ABR2S2R3_9ROSI
MISGCGILQLRIAGWRCCANINAMVNVFMAGTLYLMVLVQFAGLSCFQMPEVVVDLTYQVPKVVLHQLHHWRLCLGVKVHSRDCVNISVISLLRQTTLRDCV